MLKRSFLLSLLLCLSLTQTTPYTPPLFKAYPDLKDSLPYINLGTFPTPINHLKALGSKVNHPQLYAKMDSISGVPFGGNKVRKLEFILGEAAKAKVAAVITQGYAGSNSTCAAAIYAKQLGLPCTIMHVGQIPTRYAQRNLLLSLKNGADLHLFRAESERDKHIYAMGRKFAIEKKGPLYFIPSGCSNGVGAIGFVNAAFELKEQIAQGLMPEPDLLYVTISSCGMASGLMMGIKAAGLKTKVVPVCIEGDDYENEHEKLSMRLIKDATYILRKHDPTFPQLDIKEEDLGIRYEFIGKGYASITDAGAEGIKLLKSTEDIKLDGTYASKTFAALLHDLNAGKLKDKVVLFWNSFCSGTFEDQIKDVDYKQLPKEYHYYFQDNLLQKNDQGV